MPVAHGLVVSTLMHLGAASLVPTVQALALKKLQLDYGLESFVWLTATILLPGAALSFVTLLAQLCCGSSGTFLPLWEYGFVNVVTVAHTYLLIRGTLLVPVTVALVWPLLDWFWAVALGSCVFRAGFLRRTHLVALVALVGGCAAVWEGDPTRGQNNEAQTGAALLFAAGLLRCLRGIAEQRMVISEHGNPQASSFSGSRYVGPGPCVLQTGRARDDCGSLGSEAGTNTRGAQTLLTRAELCGRNRVQPVVTLPLPSLPDLLQQQRSSSNSQLNLPEAQKYRRFMFEPREHADLDRLYLSGAHFPLLLGVDLKSQVSVAWHGQHPLAFVMAAALAYATESTSPSDWYAAVVDGEHLVGAVCMLVAASAVMWLAPLVDFAVARNSSLAAFAATRLAGLFVVALVARPTLNRSSEHLKWSETSVSGAILAAAGFALVFVASHLWWQRTERKRDVAMVLEMQGLPQNPVDKDTAAALVASRTSSSALLHRVLASAQEQRRELEVRQLQLHAAAHQLATGQAPPLQDASSSFPASQDIELGDVTEVSEFSHGSEEESDDGLQHDTAINVDVPIVFPAQASSPRAAASGPAFPSVPAQIGAADGPLAMEPAPQPYSTCVICSEPIQKHINSCSCSHCGRTFHVKCYQEGGDGPRLVSLVAGRHRCHLCRHSQEPTQQTQGDVVAAAREVTSPGQVVQEVEPDPDDPSNSQQGDDTAN